MNDSKPTTLNEYRKWLDSEHDVKEIHRHQTHYESVVNKIQKDFEESFLWISLEQSMLDISSEYYLNTEYQLMAELDMPEILTKSFDSFFLKTFRKNVLENEQWPNPPNGEWILPQNWFSKINDMVRTQFVVKYLDGVEFLSSRIQRICEEGNLKSEVEFQAREEGYYAAHILVWSEFEIPALTWDTFKLNIAIEIQITTQVQDLIKNLLHKHYENRRIKNEPDDVKWQWDYKSEEFVTNYLGHILHYAEGMIMDVREGRNGNRQNQ